MDSRDLNTDDLEADCFPVSDKGATLQSSQKAKSLVSSKLGKGEYDHSDERFDSRFSSGYKSLESLQSGNLPSELNEGRSSDDEDLIPVSTLKSLEDLSITKDLSKKDNEPNLPSIDEGFVSQDLKHEETESSNCEFTESNCLEKENIEGYLQFVDETFQQDEDGDTRLHTAIIQLLEPYSLDIIKWVPCPSYLNIKNNYMQTPLHLATITKQPVLARKLLTSGAQVDPRDHRGNSPLHIASKEGYAELARVLVEPVQYSETKKNIYAIPFQQIPQNLEARNYDGQVCVHLAAEGGHLETLHVLLSKGADINCRDGKSGRTILHYAAESACVPLVQFLLNCPNLDLNSLTYGRQTPIMLARGRGHTEVVRLLKDRGAVYDSADSDEEDMNEEPYDDYKIAGNPV